MATWTTTSANGAMVVVAVVAVVAVAMLLAGTCTASVEVPVVIQVRSVKFVNNCAVTLNVTFSADDLAGTVTVPPPTTAIIKAKESVDVYVNVLGSGTPVAQNGRATFTVYRPIKGKDVFQQDVYVDPATLSSIVAAETGTVTVEVNDGCPTDVQTAPPGLYLVVTSLVTSLNKNICLPRSSSTIGPGPA